MTTAAEELAGAAPPPPTPPPSVRRRASALVNRHPKLKLFLLLFPPVGWMGVVYLGALALLLATAFWTLDPLTSTVVRTFTTRNIQTIIQEPVYRKIALRTVGIAAAVTIADLALAFPLAYYAARLASRRTRVAILLSVTLPLWSNYLVRAYAWRVILDQNGILNWFLDKVGLSVNVGFTNWAVWVTFTYLWLPFVFFPVYAALERIPDSFVEASSDMGARFGKTFRSVILPLALPGLVAGSIFSFSLTLGDYITPTLVGNTQFIGNIVYQNVLGISSNLPLGAAYALVPVAVMAVYLIIARRMGAFEAL